MRLHNCQGEISKDTLTIEYRFLKTSSQFWGHLTKQISLGVFFLQFIR